MSSNSKIEWTEATWNPIAGCSIVSPGCHNCYAMRTAARLEAMGQAKYAGTTKKANGKTIWTGKVNLDEQALQIPLRTRKPTVWFVNSMSDLFHEDVPDEFIDKVFAVMAIASIHTFQILTKRAERMADYCCQLCDGKRSLGRQLESLGWDCIAGRFAIAIAYGVTPCSGQDGKPPWKPFPNVWLGVSVEDQKRKTRIDWLRNTPAAVRFLSCEPLLEDLLEIDLEGIGWVIAGGESGAGSRPCDLTWIRNIVAQCNAASVPVFVKQIGSKSEEWDTEHRKPGMGPYYGNGVKHPKGGDPTEWPQDLRVRQMPKLTEEANV